MIVDDRVISLSRSMSQSDDLSGVGLQIQGLELGSMMRFTMYDDSR